MPIVACITSRWNSKRLPGKALLKIQGKPLIRHIIDRAKQTKVDEVVVATTLSSPSIISYCIRNEIPYYAYQNEWDVLGRLNEVARSYKADIIVYLWGDCPFIDPVKIDAGIEYFLKTHNYFFDPSQPVAIMDTSLLIALSTQKLSRHKMEYIHDYIIKNVIKPVIEINTREDLWRANGLL